MRSALPEGSEISSRNSALRNRLALQGYNANSTRIPLAKGSVWSASLNAGAIIQFRSLCGACWITLEGDPNDYVLHTGEILTFQGPGLLVAEGLSEINEMEQEILVSSDFEYQS